MQLSLVEELDDEIDFAVTEVPVDTGQMQKVWVACLPRRLLVKRVGTTVSACTRSGPSSKFD